jgi:hypothetical protein
MDFKSSPLGGLYTSLKKATPLKEDQELNACELRADSKTDSDLRVKTGDRSGWSSKARKAHQTNAIQIVKGYFYRSLDNLLAGQELESRIRDQIKDDAKDVWEGEVRQKTYLTLGDLRPLHERAVGFVKAKVTDSSQGLSAGSFAVTVKSPTTGRADTSKASGGVVMHRPPPEKKSITVHPAPVSAPATPQAVALQFLKTQYPLEKFPSEHGEHDAASPQKKQQAFHAKLNTLVETAARDLPRLVNHKAKEGGFKTLSSAAAAMKLNLGMSPEAALFRQLQWKEAGAFYAAHSKQVDAYYVPRD